MSYIFKKIKIIVFWLNSCCSKKTPDSTIITSKINKNIKKSDIFVYLEQRTLLNFIQIYLEVISWANNDTTKHFTIFTHYTCFLCHRPQGRQAHGAVDIERLSGLLTWIPSWDMCQSLNYHVHLSYPSKCNAWLFRGRNK